MKKGIVTVIENDDSLSSTMEKFINHVFCNPSIKKRIIQKYYW